MIPAEVARLTAHLNKVLDLHHGEWIDLDTGGQVFECAHCGRSYPCETAIAAGLVT